MDQIKSSGAQIQSKYALENLHLACPNGKQNASSAAAAHAVLSLKSHMDAQTELVKTLIQKVNESTAEIAALQECISSNNATSAPNLPLQNAPLDIASSPGGMYTPSGVHLKRKRTVLNMERSSVVRSLASAAASVAAPTTVPVPPSAQAPHQFFQLRQAKSKAGMKKKGKFGVTKSLSAFKAHTYFLHTMQNHQGFVESAYAKNDQAQATIIMSFFKNMATAQERQNLMDPKVQMGTKLQLVSALHDLVVGFCAKCFSDAGKTVPSFLCKKTKHPHDYKVLSVNSFTSIFRKCKDNNIAKIQPHHALMQQYRSKQQS